jgi:hypothetical protein
MTWEKYIIFPPWLIDFIIHQWICRRVLSTSQNCSQETVEFHDTLSSKEIHECMNVKGIWQYIFLLFHFQELLKLYVNLLYRFCVTLLFLEIFWLKIICCSPSWINFYLIGDFSDVISRVSHIKLHLNDQITLSLVWKSSDSFLFQIVTEVYDFGLIISNFCMDKILAWPCL